MERPRTITNDHFSHSSVCVCRSVREDNPSKTATGTIAIQVEDYNDHCPTLTSSLQTTCTSAAAVYVTAVDMDMDPNGAPFSFTIVQEETTGKWVLEHFNGERIVVVTG